MSYLLIDPPVSRWSSPDKIQVWIDKLETLDKNQQRDNALGNARQWLVFALQLQQDRK